MQIWNEENCLLNVCLNVWKYYIEACHRVRSIDTSSWPYELQMNDDKDKFCLPKKYKEGAYADHQIYKVYKRFHIYSSKYPDVFFYKKLIRSFELSHLCSGDFSIIEH